MTIDISTEAELQRYWNPQGGGVEPHDSGLLYLRDDVDAVIDALAAERDELLQALRTADSYLDKGLDQIARNVTRAAILKHGGSNDR